MNSRIKITIISLALFFAPSIAFGATEFISIIDPDSGTGTDFSSLSAWESTIDSDLTAATSQVFSGTRTGTMTDTTTVYLCRGGILQQGEAILVHASLTQAYLVSMHIEAVLASGDIFYTNTTCNSATYFTISDGGDSAIAVASCRSSNGTADTTAVTIDNWTTSATNYIKIWADPALGGRHDGKWNDGKYRLETTTQAITENENYVRIDGIQIQVTASSGSGANGINTSSVAGAGGLYFSNNIFKGVISGTVLANTCGVANSPDTTTNVYVWNNVFYGWDTSIDTVMCGLYSDIGTAYIYNNTAYGNRQGFYQAGGTVVFKNNAIFSNVDDVYGITFSTFEYNACDDADCDSGTGNVGLDDAESDWDTIFVDNNNEDIHLSSKDIQLRDKGVDLSSAGISDDVDGDTRPINSTWDIGADEAQTAIYRSVGPNATSAIDDDNSNAVTITISSGTATFSSAVENNVGVGDAVVYDSDLDNDLDASDYIAFIRHRTDSTHYILQTDDGAVPGNLAANDKWAIYRAYTSLANAESGTENTSIPIAFTGGDRNLVSNNEQWNIATYANGTTSDSATTHISGWTTGERNYIKIYTPYVSSEVGTSQRHTGKWDASKYNMVVSENEGIRISDDFVHIEGLQIHVSLATDYDNSAVWINAPDAGWKIYISECILRGAGSATYWHAGVESYATSPGTAYVSNCVAYDFKSSVLGAGYLIDAGVVGGDGSTMYVYNSTAYNCGVGYRRYDTGINLYLKNDIAQGCANGFQGTFDANSDYNISDLSSDAPSASYRSGLATDVSFADEANNDFHLATSNNPAINAGTDLSGDANLYFSTDIDGENRPADASWDIGADEYSAHAKAKFQGTMKFQGDINIK